MKQNLLKTWLMLLCLFLGIGGAWAETKTITVRVSSFTDLPASASYGTYSWSEDGVSGKATIYANSTSAYLQFNGSNRLFYSTTAIPGNIVSVKLKKNSGSDRAFCVYGRTSAYDGSSSTYGTQIGSSTAVTTSGTTFNVTSGEYNYFVVRNNTSSAAYLDYVEVTYEVAGGPTLSSIAVKTAPTKTTYMEGETFNPAGLVITKTMSDANTEDVAYSGNESSFTFSPSLETELSNETSVNITYSGKNTTQAITVNPFVATAGTYTINTNNGLYGVSTGNNATEQSKTKSGITIVSGCTSSASNKTYYDTDHIRYYVDSYLKLTAPTGFEITRVVFTANGTWNSGPKCGTNGTYNNTTKTWEGSTSQLDLTFSDQNRIKSIAVTYSSVKTLQSVTVSGTPTKTTYTAGESFDPAGLTVTGHYDDGSDETITEGITWSTPATLTAGQTSVDITATVGDVTSAEYTVNNLNVTVITYDINCTAPLNGSYSVKVGTEEAQTVTTATTITANYGDEVTLTATPAEGYEFGEWNVTDASSNAVTVNDNKFTMPAANVSVSATFRQLATVTLSENGSETTLAGTHYVGEEVTLPSTTTAAVPAGKTFMGWSEETVATTNDKPAYLAKGATYTITGATKTFYAVYATEIESTYDVVFNVANEAGDRSWENGTAYTDITKSPLTFKVTGGGNNGKYYTSDKTWRMYSGGAMKITATTGTIINSVTTDATSSFSKNQDGSYSCSYSGTVKYTSLTINVTGTSIGQYETSVQQKTLASISVSGTPEEFWKGDTFNHNDMTVTASYEEQGVEDEDVTAFAEFSTPDMSTDGQKTITVTYQGKTDTYNIEVLTIANTVETAYTTAQAIGKIEAGKDLNTEVYITGVVSKVDRYNDSYKSITYWLDDNAFEIYGGLAAEGEEFSSINDIEVGATVVVLGKIKKYETTYETDANSHLVSYDLKTLVLNETDTEIDEINDTYGKVTVNRTLKANVWNTFCVPFDMSSAEIKANFGEHASVKALGDYLSVSGLNFGINFIDAASIKAGVPYMVMIDGEENVTSFTVNGAKVNTTAQDNAIVTDGGNTLTFQGNYTSMKAPDASFIISSNKFYYVDSDVTVNGFRGYITTEGGAVRTLSFNFDNMLTGISSTQSSKQDARIYNLQGLQQSKFGKGVNIVNGKKVIR